MMKWMSRSIKMPTAILNKDAKFSFSLVIKRSIDFMPSELVRKDKDFTGEVGLIPLDMNS